MSDIVCNSCGAFDNVSTCSHCPTSLCNRCRHHHESTCEEIQKKKSRGLGPTIRTNERIVKKTDILGVESPTVATIREAMKQIKPREGDLVLQIKNEDVLDYLRKADAGELEDTLKSLGGNVDSTPFESPDPYAIISEVDFADKISEEDKI